MPAEIVDFPRRQGQPPLQWVVGDMLREVSGIKSAFRV
jgi:hypothetical protein